jgi:glycosyltransferase involved in cell wall biosynthesis
VKVLILPSWYPTERYPAGGIFCREQARALHTSGEAEVAVLFVDRAPVGEWLRARKPRARLAHEDGLKVYRTQMPRLPGVWPLLYVVWAVVSYRRLTGRFGFKPDVVHAHVALPAGLAGVFIKRLAGVQLVITEHTGPFSMLMRSRFAAWATRVSLRAADRVVTVSEALRDQIWAYPQLRRLIDIIHNVVDTAAFAGPRVPREPGGPYRLLSMGEMNTSIKGIDYLVGAMSLLKKRGLDCRLTLVGQGRNRREYEALSRQLGVAGLCRFMDPVPHEEIARLMLASDLYVMSSLAETFGVVLVEAMAAGLPVVATRCGGPDDIVTPDVGVLVETANSAALAEGIADVLARPDTFPEAHLRQAADERYGQNAVARRLLELYEKSEIRSQKSEAGD